MAGRGMIHFPFIIAASNPKLVPVDTVTCRQSGHVHT